jgi:hypothetical protein
MTDAETKEETFRLNGNIDPKMDFSQAVRKWTEGKLSSRPEYYCGRGVNTGDLNSDLLEMLWTGLTRSVGIPAADNFIYMVRDLTDLSATAFLKAFEEFYQNNFVWRPRKQTIADQMAYTGRSDDPHTFEALKLGMQEMLMKARLNPGRSAEQERAETEAASMLVKGRFLLNHGTKPTTKAGPKSFGFYHDSGNG